MKLTSFKCNCCEERQFNLTVPYINVFPSMEADSDDYVLKLSTSQVIEFFRLVKIEADKEKAE